MILAPAERARAVFEAAWGLPAAEQRRLLDDLASGGAAEAAAAREALSLLDEPVEAAGFLDAPLASPSFMEPSGENEHPLPERIGPYRLGRRLGEGASSVVVLGEQEHPVRRLVAIKIMRSAGAGGAARRFDWERQVLARLEHPGIARFIDAGALADGRPYFIMEYVEGEPITRAAAALPLRERLALLRAACEAVEYAHRNGVIHRDLKPQNVLACVADGRAAVKVIDFGISRPDEQSNFARATFTQQGILVGTPAYMSPERLGTGAAADARADVYALGVILHELACGRLPFTAPDLPSLIAAIVTGRRERPRRLAADLTRDLEAVMDLALATDPASRYQSVAALREDLERLDRGRAVIARRDSLALAVARSVRRRPVTSAAGAAAAVAVLALAAHSWTQARSEAAAFRAALAAMAPTQEVITFAAERLHAREDRERMVGNALAACRGLRDLRPRDLDLMDREAQLRSAMGTLHLEGANVSPAMDEFQEVRSLRQTIAQRRPTAENRVHLSTALVRVGDAEKAAKAQGRGEAAWVEYARAEAIVHGVLNDHPDHRGALVMLGWSHERMAEQPGIKAADVRKRYDQMLDAATTLDQLIPDDPGALRLLGAAHSHLGDWHRLGAAAGEAGADLRAVKPHTLTALVLARRAMAISPADRECHRFLVYVLGKAARARSIEGEHPAAMALSGEAVERIAGLSTAHPADAELALRWLETAHAHAVVADAAGRPEATTLVLERVLNARNIWSVGVLRSTPVRHLIVACLLDLARSRRWGSGADTPAVEALEMAEQLLREDGETQQAYEWLFGALQAQRRMGTLDPQRWHDAVTRARALWPGSNAFGDLDLEGGATPPSAPPPRTPAP